MYMTLHCRFIMGCLILAAMFFGARGLRAEKPPEAPSSAITSGFDALRPLADYAASRLDAKDAVFPEAFVQDRAPRDIILAVSDGIAPAQVHHGGGAGWREAIDRAIAKISDRAPSGGIELTFVTARRPIGQLMLSRRIVVEHGLEGIHVAGEVNWIIPPTRLVAGGMLGSRGLIRWYALADAYAADVRARGAEPDIAAFAGADADAITGVSFFISAGGIEPLYRGHRRVETLSDGMLLDAAKRGGEYLIRSVREDGRFDYLYKPSSGKPGDGYNILRHAGTIYAMLELYETTRDKALLIAARRALDWMRSQCRPMRHGDVETLVLVEGDEVKLGGNALAILAITQYIVVTGDRSMLADALALERWIRAVQDPNGRFGTHIQIFSSGAVRPFESAYYPGEAILALLRLPRIVPDEARLDSADRAARWLITFRDIGLRADELPADHWLLYALNELHRERADDLYLDHAMKIARGIVDSQTRQSQWEDVVGSWGDARSTPASTRNEGLLAAYALARDFNREEDARKIRAALEWSMRFQLQCQFGRESVLHYPDPARTLGGVRGSLVDDEIRIDYVQHFISAALAMRGAME